MKKPTSYIEDKDYINMAKDVDNLIMGFFDDYPDLPVMLIVSYLLLRIRDMTSGIPNAESLLKTILDEMYKKDKN